MIQQCAPGSVGWAGIYERLVHDANDATAFAALTARVRGWTWSRLPEPIGPAYREDIVADTCSSVVVGIREARGAETFPSFVYGHFRNARRRLMAGSQYTVPLGQLDVPEAAPSLPMIDELGLLQRCLLALPPRERRAVELRYLHDESTRDVAGQLGVSVVNARQIVFSGLARLRAQARQHWPLGRG